MHKIMKNTFCILTLYLCATVAAAAASRPHFEWAGTWATAPEVMFVKGPIGNSTFRNIVRTSIGGAELRVVLTNQFGKTPLLVGNAHIAISAGGGRLEPGSDHQLTFDRQTSVSIPPGAYVLSDPMPMRLAAFTSLAISIYLTQQTVAVPTCHQVAQSTNYIAGGDATAETELAGARTQTSWCFLQEVDVQTKDKDAGAIVALGDSITDGARSTLDANHRYPDYLAERLHADRKTAHLSVLNEGISGGRVLFEGHGPSALERFDRDVLAQPGVRYVIYLEGINDIGQMRRPDSPEHTLTAQDLIFAATQLVARAHEHGVKVFGATLLPFGPRDIPEKVRPEWARMREVMNEYNDWVRTGGVFDGVIDFYKAMEDPKDPEIMLPAYDSGDHGHPNDAGYKVMADAIDLKLFH